MTDRNNDQPSSSHALKPIQTSNTSRKSPITLSQKRTDLADYKTRPSTVKIRTENLRISPSGYTFERIMPRKQKITDTTGNELEMDPSISKPSIHKNLQEKAPHTGPVAESISNSENSDADDQMDNLQEKAPHTGPVAENISNSENSDADDQMDNLLWTTDDDDDDDDFQAVEHISGASESDDDVCLENYAPQMNQKECSCGLADENETLRLKVASLENKIKLRAAALRKKLDVLDNSNNRLQRALTSKLLPPSREPFTSIEGFPSVQTLLKMSIEAKDSDYLFVKFLMNALWVDGFVGRCLSERTSNNPKGRPSNKLLETQSNGDCPTNENSGPASRIPLERTRVEYVRDRLYERRLFLDDSRVVAAQVATTYKKLMHAVIANSTRR
ncbi:uncharacterized protein LOC134284168 [Aedes albopictus]|uniref:BEN domain-containing protein n=1 Tax=Aedes albopictus TaxID=7160 RepID=A0ABM1ZYM3_AEDAL